MAIGAYFQTNGMTLDQYFEIHRRLEAAGVREQAGRLHHSCFGESGSLHVFDIWESPEAFEAFGQKLMPILAELGVDAGEPAVMPIQGLDQTAVEGNF